jgi:hypothetical protein
MQNPQQRPSFQPTPAVQPRIVNPSAVQRPMAPTQQNRMIAPNQNPGYRQNFQQPRYYIQPNYIQCLSCVKGIGVEMEILEEQPPVSNSDQDTEQDYEQKVLETKNEAVAEYSEEYFQDGQQDFQ